MAQKFIIFAAAVCIFAAFVHSAPQFNSQNQFRGTQQLTQTQQTFQAQPIRAQDPERQSRFLVVDEKFNQNPETKEYNFE